MEKTNKIRGQKECLYTTRTCGFSRSLIFKTRLISQVSNLDFVNAVRNNKIGGKTKLKRGAIKNKTDNSWQILIYFCLESTHSIPSLRTCSQNKKRHMKTILKNTSARVCQLKSQDSEGSLMEHQVKRSRL